MEEKKKPKKRKKSNYELSQSIIKKRNNVKKITQNIKNQSIRKNQLINSIYDDIDELTMRFKK